VIGGLTNDARVAREEIFGPVLVVLAHDGDADAVRIANDGPYGLSGAVAGADPDRVDRVASRLRTGTINVNGGVWYSADVPFGGYKPSGVGREMGLVGFEEYLQTKVIATGTGGPRRGSHPRPAMFDSPTRTRHAADAAGPIGCVTVTAMSTASVLIAPESTTAISTPRYTLLLSSDPEHIEAAQRLRHRVFTCEPGYTLDGDSPGFESGRDADRFDEYCDHLLVREDNSGEFVGCYRMLPPPGAIAAGGLYTATEFDVTELDVLRPSMVEMGRAVVRDDHRNGAVVLLMWGGILAYLDRSGYDFVTGCVSVPIAGDDGEPPATRIRGVRDFVKRRHASEYTMHPYRPVVIDGKALDEIEPPARVTVPPLMRGYLRLGAKVCGDPAHDPDFGVGDFPALLDKRHADVRYLKRLRSAGAAAADAR
jgi:putative hemolysin